MKKTTLGLIGAVLVIMLSSNTWAHPGLRINIGGNGFGFSVSDVHSGFSTFSYNTFRPYPYYSGYYPNRPYLGWGGYKGHRHHHNHKHWNHHRSRHNHKGHHYGHQRNYKRGDQGHRHRKHQRRNHNRRQWLR